MAGGSAVFASLAFLLSSFFMSANLALHIEMKPDKIVKESSGPVNISCITDKVDDGTDDVYLLEITKNGEPPMVFLRKGSGIAYGDATPKLAQADGTIDKDVANTYLTLTLTNPSSHDNGLYTCMMFFTDRLGLLSEHRSSETLLIQNFDDRLNAMVEKVALLESALQVQTSLLENSLKSQADRVTLLEDQSRQQKRKSEELDVEGANVVERVTVLEDLTRNQSQRITMIGDKVTYACAFSAALTAYTKPVNGATVVFSDVIMKQGNGYDEKTGIFVAPKPGVYAFHLVVMVNCVSCWADFAIMVNDHIMARDSVTAHAGGWGQASMSTVADLKLGDKIKVVCTGSNNNGNGMRDNRFSVFTGYLIRTH